MLGFSWTAFVVYVAALMFVVGGGFVGLMSSHDAKFLAPILMGLFFFYLTWEAVVEDTDELPPPSKDT